MLEQFHPFMEYYIKEKVGEDTNYRYSKVDTPEYRINLYNYMSKEDRKVWTNNDLYKPKRDGINTPELDAYDKIALKVACSSCWKKQEKSIFSLSVTALIL